MPSRAPDTPPPPVSVRRRLGAHTIDLIVSASPLVVFFGLPERGNWGSLFGLIFGVGGCVPLFLVLQGTLLFRRGRTLGMAYFGLELAPSQQFGVTQPLGVAVFSGLQLLVASAVLGEIYYPAVRRYSLSASDLAWLGSAVFTLVVLVPNLLSIVMPGHRSLAERLCRMRSVESNAARADNARAKVRGLGYLVDALLFALSLVPCGLLASSIADPGDTAMALLPAVFMCGALLVFQLWAWLSARETIGTRALRSTP